MEWDERIAFARKWPHHLSSIGGPEVPRYLMPHATYTCSPEHLAEIAALAQEIDAKIHIHASENAKENSDVASRYNKTPTEILASSGILDRHTIYGHGVHLSASDITTLGDKGSAVAHCPGSNLKLASGIANVTSYRQSDVTVALGTDGCSSSNDLDMWVVMRLAALLISQTQGPETLSTADIFRMATIDGARALGISDLIGSIEIGKCADLITIDLDAPHLIPIHDIFAQLVFAAGRSDVCDVWVDGRQVIANRKSTMIDFADLSSRVASRVSQLKK
jgi:5-methylthioadenosine/S-adenosylhomocysteine deaminase